MSAVLDAAVEAVRIATTYRTPVFLLSDGYVANGSEPWRLPAVEELPDISVEFATEANHTDAEGNPEFWPYLRDPSTMARPWAVPGTPGLEHRIGGIEKQDGTGNISYDPANHEHMVHVRADRIAGIAHDIPPVEVHGDVDDAELFVIGWGSTWGAIDGAVNRCRRRGRRVAHAHLVHLNPFPANLGEVLRRYPRIVVPELNLGQLSRLLRAEYLVDARSDIWSVGVLLYECLTAEKLFSCDDFEQKRQMIMAAKLPPLPFTERGLPTMIEKIITRCCQQKPEHRYQSATSLLHSLNAVYPKPQPRIDTLPPGTKLQGGVLVLGLPPSGVNPTGSQQHEALVAAPSAGESQSGPEIVIVPAVVKSMLPDSSTASVIKNGELVQGGAPKPGLRKSHVAIAAVAVSAALGFTSLAGYTLWQSQQKTPIPNPNAATTVPQDPLIKVSGVTDPKPADPTGVASSPDAKAAPPAVTPDLGVAALPKDSPSPVLPTGDEKDEAKDAGAQGQTGIAAATSPRVHTPPNLPLRGPRAKAIGEPPTHPLRFGPPRHANLAMLGLPAPASAVPFAGPAPDAKDGKESASAAGNPVAAEKPAAKEATSKDAATAAEKTAAPAKDGAATSASKEAVVKEATSKDTASRDGTAKDDKDGEPAKAEKPARKATPVADAKNEPVTTQEAAMAANAILRKATPQVGRCYPAEVVPPTKISVELTVAKNGKITEASVEGAGDQTACVRNAVKLIRLGAISDADSYNLQYDFVNIRR